MRGAIFQGKQYLGNVHLNLESVTTWITNRCKRIWSIFASANTSKGKTLVFLPTTQRQQQQPHKDPVPERRHCTWLTSCPLPRYVIPLAALALVNRQPRNLPPFFSLPTRARHSMQSNPVQSNPIQFCFALQKFHARLVESGLVSCMHMLRLCILLQMHNVDP